MENNDRFIEHLKSWIKQEPYPYLDNLIKHSWPTLELIGYLSSLATGRSVSKSQTSQQEKTSFDFVDHDNRIVLSLAQDENNNIFVTGNIVEELKALLVAIRIHEFDSYDWVWLAPDMRERRVSDLVQNVGITKEQLRRATSLWTEK